MSFDDFAELIEEALDTLFNEENGPAAMLSQTEPYLQEYGNINGNFRQEDKLGPANRRSQEE